MQWNLLLFLHLGFIVMTHQSIDGVTYQTHFDFEERYANVHECDPFYWHPLHLPEHCLTMFENLIRSRVAALTPVRIVRKRTQPNYYSYIHDYQNNFEDEDYRFNKHHRQHDSDESEDENDSMSPYEEMFSLLNKDVKKNPTAPVVGMMPHYGPVAMYKQPISKKSKKLIKKIARAYADAGQVVEDKDYYYGKIDVKKSPDLENANNGSDLKESNINIQNKTENLQVISINNTHDIKKIKKLLKW